MLVVGLTGGIASGKSTASYLISSHPAKIPIIDLDLLAREVVEPGQPALAALRSTFGPSVINESDGTLNRAELGRLAFATPEKTKLLNKITHGAIRRRMVWKLLTYWVRGEKVVVVDTPLLVEAGLWKFCGELVLVYCRKEDQLTRMLARDGQSKGLTEEDAKQRLAFIPAGRDGTLSVIGFSGGKPQVLETVPTQRGARTIALDERTGRLYLPSATYVVSSQTGRPTPVGGTAQVIVVGK